MKHNKLSTLGYLSKHLNSLENMPVNEKTLHLVDSITSIDRSLYRKDWYKVYKKCKKTVETIEKEIEANDEESHYFVYCDSLIESLYLTAYSALSKTYCDGVSITNDELDSMDEFISTVKEKYGNIMGELIVASPSDLARKRLLVMTNKPKECQVTEEADEMLEKVSEMKSDISEALEILQVYRSKNGNKKNFINEIETILVKTQGALDNIQ